MYSSIYKYDYWLWTNIMSMFFHGMSKYRCMWLCVMYWACILASSQSITMPTYDMIDVVHTREKVEIYMYVCCKHIPHPRQYQQEAYTLHMGKNFEVSQHCTLNYFFPFFKLIVPTRVLALPKKNNDNALSLLFKMGNE